MITARKIMKGTFRLSIAVAFVIAAYSFYERWIKFSESQDSNHKLVTTIECGGRLPDATLQSAVNQYGNIDLGKAGCADRQFWASFSEIEQARTGAMMREWMETKFNLSYAAVHLAMRSSLFSSSIS